MLHHFDEPSRLGRNKVGNDHWSPSFCLLTALSEASLNWLNQQFKSDHIILVHNTQRIIHLLIPKTAFPCTTFRHNYRRCRPLSSGVVGQPL